MLNDPMALLLSTAGKTEGSVDIDLLKSRKVLDKVIDRANLQMTVVRDSNNMFMYLLKKIFKMPDTKAHIVFTKYSEKVKQGEISAGPQEYTISSNGKNAQCVWNEPCDLGGEEVVLEKIGEITENTDYSFSYLKRYERRSILQSSLVVFPSENSANLLNLSFVHQSPAMGAYILNRIVDAYLEVKREWQKDDEVVKQDYINSVLDRLQEDIDKKSSRMILFQKEKETLVPEVQIEELIKKQEVLKAKVEEVNLKISLLKESISAIKETPDSPVIIPMIFEDLSFQETLKSHNKLIFNKNELLKNMTPEHPAVAAAQREIEESAGSLEQMLNENINTLKKSRDVTRQLLALISSDKKKLPENLFAFEELKRDIELAEKVFVTLSAKLYQSSIDPNTGILPVRIIDTPDPEVPKSSPKTSIFGLLVIFFSLLIGVAAVFIKEFFFIPGEKENEKN
jgi:uncharacterized protein involved in exopolysaccharide biosynthesis